MTTSGSDSTPNPKPGGEEERDDSGSAATSGWQYPATGPSASESGGSAASTSGGGQNQPTGWERPTSESDTGGPQSPSTPTSSPETPPAPSAPVSSPSSAPDWPSYPESGGTESTRPLPPEQPYSSSQAYSPAPDSTPPATPYQAPYQPYDQQSMPSYGSSSSYPTPDAPQGYPESGQSGGGYGNNPYEVNPYQQGQYGGYVGYGPPPNHPQAVTALVLGLVGLVVCTPVGIGGLVMGARVRREIDADPSRYSGRGLATAGWVMGIISVVILVLLVVGLIISLTANSMGY